MYKFCKIEMNAERKTDLVEEELEEFDEKEDFFQPEESWDEDEDEPYEKEYCD